MTDNSRDTGETDLNRYFTQRLLAIYELREANLTETDNYVGLFNDFFTFMFDTSVDQIVAYIRTLDRSQITEEQIGAVHFMLSAQVFGDLRSNARLNVPLYVSMAKLSILFELAKRRYASLYGDEALSEAGHDGSTRIGRLYASVFPLATYMNGLETTALERKSSQYLETFLKTHQSPDVRRIANIKVRKVDNSNEYTLDPELMEKIKLFSDQAAKM